jgi:hypothetical protein
VSGLDLYPSYGMWHRPWWQTTTFYVIVVLGAFCLLILLMWVLFKRYKASRQRSVPAWQIAIRELEELERELSQGTILGKTFYFRLTWIFKRFLHDRYGFDVYGKTDEELFVYLEHAGLNTDLGHDLRVIFEGSRDVKFAHQNAVLDRLKRDLTMSFDFIRKTTPTDQVGR